MKTVVTWYYLLFVVLVFGAFASMAQNNYGTTIIGIVSFAFALLFAIQLLHLLTADKKPGPFDLLELVVLILLSAIFGLRVFYIHFPFVEFLFGAAGLFLIVVYLEKIRRVWADKLTKNYQVKLLLTGFYISIILYASSITTIPFFPVIAKPLGTAGFTLLVAVFLTAFVKKDVNDQGAKIAMLPAVIRPRDRSLLLVTFFLLFTVYAGFTLIGFLPKLYSNEYPQLYFELVDKAESGHEAPVNGKYKYQVFKKEYDQFVNKNQPDKK